ncbi:unnamed protein product [Cuscuta epithymum]|uniref:Uncharacterized protein n=1 Tax=Cuscuta epithymum TaxID=186058 RepID=A0AAV0DWD8_9ASTE|nr:unnamed protein product [Cuscuta epithymum]
MKACGCFSVLVLVIGAAFIYLFYSTAQDCTFSRSGEPLTWQRCGMATTIKNRKLKDGGVYDKKSLHQETVEGKLNLEDYGPIDPVPSSKASVRPGPIKHDTPFLPYLPKPPAPPPKGA